MKRAISTLLVASMLAMSAPAWAADQAPVTSPVVSPLVKAQPAPFTGVLLSPEAVAQVIAERDAAAQAMTLAIKHQVDLDAAELKFQIDQLTTTCTADKSDLQAQVDDNKKQVQILNDQLKKSTSGPGAPVWLGLGAVGGIVLTVAVVFAVGKATK